MLEIQPVKAKEHMTQLPKLKDWMIFIRGQAQKQHSSLLTLPAWQPLSNLNYLEDMNTLNAAYFLPKGWITNISASFLA